MPGLFNGLRLGLATCLITLVATEFVGADDGLGAMIYRAGQQFAVDQMYAGLFLVGVIGLAANLLFLALEPIVLPWQKRGLKESTEMVSQGA